MSVTGTKKNRMLEIFFRAMKGENISVKKLADEYGVSSKSISRGLGEIKNFLYDNRELVRNTELKYSASSKTYYLEFDNFLLSKELISVIKMIIGCRAFSKMEVLEIISKLKGFTSFNDRATLEKLIMKEMYHYKIPTAKVVDKVGNVDIIEVDAFGTGINMFLLSQGKMVKALYPESFVNEMKNEIENMCNMYK